MALWGAHPGGWDSFEDRWRDEEADMSMVRAMLAGRCVALSALVPRAVGTSQAMMSRGLLLLLIVAEVGNCIIRIS